MNFCVSVCVSVPYRSTHRSSDCDETFTSCCKHSRGSFGNKKIKNCTSRDTRCCPFSTGAHTVHPIAMKLSQIIVNMLAVVSEILKFKNYTSWSTRCCLIGAFTFHPIAM